jgi:hypothetical protein
VNTNKSLNLFSTRRVTVFFAESENASKGNIVGRGKGYPGRKVEFIVRSSVSPKHMVSCWLGKYSLVNGFEFGDRRSHIRVCNIVSEPVLSRFDLRFVVDTT